MDAARVESSPRLPAAARPVLANILGREDFSIRSAVGGDQLKMELTQVPVSECPGADDGLGARLREQVQGNFAYVWRLLRRLGLSPTDADDAAQQVFIVLSRKIGELSVGKERAFLYGTAVRIAWRARRTLERRREELCDPLAEAEGHVLTPDQLLLQRQARTLLDRILGAMPLPVRTVFVLFELEGLNLTEISEALSVPRGTVASRLRRGREEFQRAVQRLERTSSVERPPLDRMERTGSDA